MDSEMPAEFADCLKEYRLRAGLTQEALAARAGVSPRNIQNLERARNRPLADTAGRLVTALCLDAADRARFLAMVTASPRRRAPTPAPALTMVATATSAQPSLAGRLPLPPTRFVGRDREVALVRGLLADGARLITLTGVGGAGKTRLAIEVAREVADRFADGVAFVDLTATRDTALVPLLIAQALDLRAADERPPADLLANALRDRHLLLVLDNCEHVLAAAPLVATLLAAAPRLSVLATSRLALRLYGEHEARVPPLETPDAEDEPIADVVDYPVVQLFLQRARAARPDLALTAAHVPDVAEICRQLDGLPLAIELAAARVKLFTPRQVLERLDGRLTLLVGGPRDLPARQQTLRNLLDWSYALLTPRERRLFAHLGVFAGSWDLDGAATICGVADAQDTEEAAGPEEVEALADAGLLEYVAEGPTAPRFRMLETVREYALARLAESGDADVVRRTHAGYYVTLAERAEPQLIGPDQVVWTRRLDAEQGNVRAALSWLIPNDAPGALRLAGALGRYWMRGRSLMEGRRWLEAALARAEGPAAPRAKALVVAGLLVADMNDYDRAEALEREALAVYEATGDRAGRAAALVGLGAVAFLRGDLPGARRLQEEALALYRDLGDPWGTADTLYRLAAVELVPIVHPASASTHEGHNLDGSPGSRPAARRPSPDDLAPLADTLAESHTLFARVGDRWGIAVALINLAVVAFCQGQDARERRLTAEGLAFLRELGETMMAMRYVRFLALMADARGEPERATRLVAASDRLLAAAGAPWPRAHQANLEQDLNGLRAQLGEDKFIAAWTEGRRMTLDAALRDGLGPAIQ